MAPSDNDGLWTAIYVASECFRFAELQSTRAIPPNERCTMKWNGNPFQMDCNSEGRTEDDGAFFLLPYWLGRYHKVFPP